MVLLLLALACESDAAKLDRLQRDKALAVLERLRWQQEVGDHPSPALEDSLHAAENRLILARRELDRFLDGR